MSDTPNTPVQRGAGLVAWNSASSLVTRVLQLTVLLWVNQYLLKRVSPDEYCLFPLIVSLMVVADLVTNVFTGGLGRYLVEADARNDSEELRRIASSMLPILGCMTLVLLAAGGLMIWKLDRVLEIEPVYLWDARVMLGLAVFQFCMVLLTAPFTSGLYIRQRFHTQNVVELSCEVFRIGLLLVLLLLVDTRVLWLMVAATAGKLLRLAIHYRYTRIMLPDIAFERRSFSRATAGRLIRFGAWTSVQGITDLASNTVPLWILNRFGTAVDVSAFHIGRLPNMQLRSIISAAAAPAQPALTSLYAKSGETALESLYYRGGRYHLWMSLVVVAPLLVFGQTIVKLYTVNQYPAAYPVMLCLLGGYPLIWASAMFYRVAHAIGRVGAYYACDIIVQVVTIGALLYAVALKGGGAAGAGAAIGLIGAIAHVVLIWPMGLRLIGGSWKHFLKVAFLPGILPFLAALSASLILQLTMSPDTWLEIGVASCISLLVYICVLGTRCLDPVDRQLAGRAVERIQRLSGRLVPTRG